MENMNASIVEVDLEVLLKMLKNMKVFAVGKRYRIYIYREVKVMIMRFLNIMWLFKYIYIKNSLIYKVILYIYNIKIWVREHFIYSIWVNKIFNL